MHIQSMTGHPVLLRTCEGGVIRKPDLTFLLPFNQELSVSSVEYEHGLSGELIRFVLTTPIQGITTWYGLAHELKIVPNLLEKVIVFTHTNSDGRKFSGIRPVDRVNSSQNPAKTLEITPK
jgi:hypothetical protein